MIRANATVNLSGSIHLSDSLLIEKPVTINGNGATINSTASHPIRIACDGPVVLRDFVINSNGPYGIFVTDGGSSPFGNCDSKFDNVRVYGGDYGIYFEAANHWDLTKCHMIGQKKACVVVDNIRNGDAGDSSITAGTELWADKDAMASVIQYASGGLRIIGSKLAGGGPLDNPTTNFGYLLDLQDRPYPGGIGTGILEISGCSFEAHDVASICLTNNTKYGFLFSSIVGNQIRGGIVINRPVHGNDRITHVAISANTIMSHQATGDSGIAIGGGEGINITGNVIDCRGVVGYGISNGGGEVWQGNNTILRPRIAKTIGVFQPY
jgi:hypothetical protein